MMNNNKESFKLLSVAGSGSDSESEVPEFVLTPKKKRLKRRIRANHALTRTHDTQSKSPCGRRNISLTLAAVFLFCWLFTLSWLTVLLHGNIQQLDEMVQRDYRGPNCSTEYGVPLNGAWHPGAVMVSGTTRLLQRSAAEDMDGVPLRVPLRAGLPGPLTGTPGTTGTVMGSGIKKMRKRRELDALAKRCPPSNGVHKRCGGQGAGGGLSSHDQLLSESSGDDSSALPLPGYKPGYTLSSLGPLNSNGYTPGFAVKRRRPGRGGYPMLRQRPCAQVMRVCIGLLVLACVIATLTVMWLFIDVREQVFSLRTEIEQVVAGSQAVPDDLQKIHSLSRELQQNQTQLTLRVNTIAAQVANLSQQLVLVQTGLKVYSDQLQSNPEPSNVKELMKNVASLGSQIKDLHNTVKSVEQHQTSLDHLTETIDKNLTAVVSSISQLSNVTLRPATLDPNVVHTIENLRQVIAQTSANVSEANSTLTKRLQWLQDDQVKDHKAIEILQDLGQNVSARIKTLEGECAKIDAQKTINSTLYELKEQVNLDAQRVNSIEHTLSSLPQSATQKPPADSKSIMVEESKESLPVTLAEPVEGSRTTPGG